MIHPYNGAVGNEVLVRDALGQLAGDVQHEGHRFLVGRSIGQVLHEDGRGVVQLGDPAQHRIEVDRSAAGLPTSVIEVGSPECNRMSLIWTLTIWAVRRSKHSSMNAGRACHRSMPWIMLV